MKPSDLQLARLCQVCAMENEVKKTAMKRDDRWELLATMQEDALVLNEAWIQYLEEAKRKSLPVGRCEGCPNLVDGECQAEYQHEEPPGDCALDELNIWLATDGPGLGPGEQRDWLLKWANRRAANVIDFMVEPMREIATSESGASARFVATQALKTACLKGVQDGKDEDRVVR